jgi:hypothetical protein
LPQPLRHSHVALASIGGVGRGGLVVRAHRDRMVVGDRLGCSLAVRVVRLRFVLFVIRSVIKTVCITVRNIF